MSNFNAQTTADEAATAFSDQIRGKSVLVTGVSPENLGSEFVLSISAHSPSLIVLAGRKLSNLKAAEDVLKKSNPSIPSRLLILDLSSQAKIREAATEVEKYKERIDVLVNNAAIMACPYGKTVDGVEMQFGVNHIGPFLFTNLLLKSDKLGEGARIVVVSSEAHHLSTVNFEDCGFSEGKTYDGGKSYGQSKTANILFALSLAKNFRGKGITAFSLHPGAIATNLLRNLPEETIVEMGWKNAEGEFVNSPQLTWKTLQQGTATHVVAAFDTSIVDESGSYLCDARVTNEACAEYAKNEENAEKLWKLSEELVGEKFEV